jgi:hypothetical protein
MAASPSRNAKYAIESDSRKRTAIHPEHRRAFELLCASLCAKFWGPLRITEELPTSNALLEFTAMGLSGGVEGLQEPLSISNQLKTFGFLGRYHSFIPINRV